MKRGWLLRFFLGLALLASAPAWGRSFYGWPTEVVPRPEEARVMEAIAEELPGFHGRPLQWDAGLVEAARQVAGRLARDFRVRENVFSDDDLYRYLREAGVFETRLYYSYIVFNRPEELSEFIRRRVARSAAGESFTHVGAGLVRGSRGTGYLVVVLTTKLVTLDPFPRQLPGPGDAALGGWMAAAGRGMKVKGLLTLPSGEVVPLEIRNLVGRFWAEVPLRRGPGLYHLELIAERKGQTMLAGLMEVRVDGPGPGTAEPDDFYFGHQHLVTEAESEMAMVRMINSFRARQNLPLLQVNPGLMIMARDQSRDMMTHNFFGHESPTRGDFARRCRTAGFAGVRMQENLAIHTSLDGAMKALLESPAHRRNLTDPEFDSVGVGIVVVEYSDQRTYYISQEFARLGSHGR
jgi:uncharacterized protein YkwD